MRSDSRERVTHDRVVVTPLLSVTPRGAAAGALPRPDGAGGRDVGHTGRVSDMEAEIEDDSGGSPRPPTKVPGVWRELPTAVKVLLVALVLIAGAGIFTATRLTSQSEAQFDNGVVV